MNIRMSKFIMGGSLNIYIFLRDEEPGRDALGWVKEPGFVGVAGMLSVSQRMMGAGDGEGEKGESHGEVPLTAALEAKVRMGELASLREDVVGGYLRGALRWRVARVSLCGFY